jgi:uncharacterized protein YqiB (DUF1249 family)
MFDTMLSVLYNIKFFFPATLINHNLPNTNVRLNAQASMACVCSLSDQELYACDKLSAIIENCNGSLESQDENRTLA